ncbi:MULTISPECIES: hypothetical protein [unclassified Nocardiopsis]|uniref:hypothetical protein n=1 Tax=Nocardiopsis TaxID=2013 RepID=UPI00387ABBF1
MEIVTQEAASQLGVSQRQVQRLARGGRFVSRTVAGRTVLAGRSLVAVSRSRGRGRRWDDRTVAAAAELLDSGSTETIEGSQRSRLRARLRTISMQELAYQVLGDRVTLWRSTRSSPGAGGLVDGLSSTGEGLEVKVVQNATTFARRARLLEDADGGVLLIELDTKAPSVVAEVALYAYGDVRTSNIAQQRVQERQAALK